MTTTSPPEKFMYQRAPYPHELADLVSKWHHRPGWRLYLANMDRDSWPSHHITSIDEAPEDHCVGLTLVISVLTTNSYHAEICGTCHSAITDYPVNHLMPVPAATYNRQSWRRWVLEQILLVERHEAVEFTEIDGEHPWAPVHAPGHDPYIIFEMTTDEARRTSFRGELNPA